MPKQNLLQCKSSKVSQSYLVTHHLQKPQPRLTQNPNAHPQREDVAAVSDLAPVVDAALSSSPAPAPASSSCRSWSTPRTPLTSSRRTRKSRRRTAARTGPRVTAMVVLNRVWGPGRPVRRGRRSCCCGGWRRRGRSRPRPCGEGGCRWGGAGDCISELPCRALKRNKMLSMKEVKNNKTPRVLHQLKHI